MIETAKTTAAIKKLKLSIPVPLFWRLFLSLLAMILITSVLSIAVERWLNERELATRMDSQIDKLLIQRERLVTSLKMGDLSAVKQLYGEDRRLMSQIRIYDEQGAIIFPRYRSREGRDERRQARDIADIQSTDTQTIENPPYVSSNPQRSVSSSIENKASDYYQSSDKERGDKNPYRAYSFDKDSANSERSTDKPFSLDDILRPIPPHKAIADIDSRPELAEVTVVMPNGDSVIIQLRPHLLFKDVLELQRGNFMLRLLLIILFSVLEVCKIRYTG